jgi:pimeloyl-ACP methyl ester carboxylesterase
MRSLPFLYALIVAAVSTAAYSPRLSGDDTGNEKGAHQSLDWFMRPGGELANVTQQSEWEIRRSSIIKGFEAVAGPLPSREILPDPDIIVSERIETGTYIRETITFQSEPGESGDRIPAFLYYPTGVKPEDHRPGIVALHPTHTIGKQVVDGQSERPNRGYAKELAERGYVVIAPDYPSFGDSSDYDFSSDRYESGTMKAIWNHMRCVDLLWSRDDVDKEKIGAIGHSLGGHNAIFLGVFDRRVKVIISSCGWTPFHDYYGGDLKGWTSDRYMPSIRDKYGSDPDRMPFDFYELVGALAPAAFFSNSPLRDSNFDYRGIEKAAPKVRRIYELYASEAKLRLTYPDAEHDFPTPVREEAYDFLARWLEAP